MSNVLDAKLALRGKRAKKKNGYKHQKSTRVLQTAAMDYPLAEGTKHPRRQADRRGIEAAL